MTVLHLTEVFKAAKKTRILKSSRSSSPFCMMLCSFYIKPNKLKRKNAIVSPKWVVYAFFPKDGICTKILKRFPCNMTEWVICSWPKKHHWRIPVQLQMEGSPSHKNQGFTTPNREVEVLHMEPCPEKEQKKKKHTKTSIPRCCLFPKGF